MQLPRISTIPSKPRVKRLKKSKHISTTNENNIIDSQNPLASGCRVIRISSPSSKEMFIRKKVIWPEVSHPSMYTHRKDEQNKKRRRKSSLRGLYYLLCVATCVALLLVAIAAIIILATRSKTTLSTSTSILTTFTTENITTVTATTTISAATQTASTTSVITTTNSSSSTASSVTTITSTNLTSSSNSNSSTASTSASVTTSTVTISTSIIYTSTTSSSSTSTTTSSSSTSTTTSISSTTSTVTTTTVSTTKTTTTTTASTTTYSCSASQPASLAKFDDNTETNWTRYAYNYTATKTNPTISFGVDGSSELYIMIDDVSIIDITNSSVQLLDNPSFDDSSTTLSDWFIWCSSTCSSGSGGSIATSACRTSNCYKSQCRGGSDVDYLVQPFSAIVSRIYTVSFWFKRGRSSGSGGTGTLYVGII